MSEGIIIALISFAGAVLGAAITGFATIVAASLKGKDEGQSHISCGLLGLLASLGAVGGLVLGAFFSVLLIQQTTAGGVSPSTNIAPVERSSDSQYLPPSSDIRLEERQETGTGTRIVYNVKLTDNEVIVGDSYKFQDKDVLCNAFLIQGPGQIQFAVLDGAWLRYSGVTTQDKAEDLLQGRVKYLQEHWFCKDVGVNVVRLRAGG